MFSLVSTVLNDLQSCQLFFKEIETQTYLPNEIVIVDGGSTDGTWEFLSSYKPSKNYQLRVFQEVGCNVARGRNLAITQAKFDIIASTDIGCSWDDQWLEELVTPLIENPELDAVMGSWNVLQDDCETRWAKVDFDYQRGLTFIATPQSDASSRSIAYRKRLWQKIGGYPEDLTLAGDDMVFSLLLHSSTKAIAASTSLHCHWKLPQTLKSILKEARRNFRGAGEAGIWLNYGLLVGFRLLIEIFFLLTGLVTLFLPNVSWLSFVCFLGFILCLLIRLIKLRSPLKAQWNRYQLRGVIDLVIFEYLIKIWSLIGFWEGYFYGKQHCSDCRLALAKVSEGAV